MPIFVPQRLLFISFNEAIFEDNAISIPTFSKRGILASFETLETTLLTPSCFKRSEHKRFFSSLKL